MKRTVVEKIAAKKAELASYESSLKNAQTDLGKATYTKLVALAKIEVERLNAQSAITEAEMDAIKLEKQAQRLKKAESKNLERRNKMLAKLENLCKESFGARIEVKYIPLAQK
jgi:hypothetical protein